MNEQLDEIRKRVNRLVLDRLDYKSAPDEAKIYDTIDDVLIKLPERRRLSLDDSLLIRREVFNSIKKLDIIQEYLDDENITEIMINGYNAIFVERAGFIYKTDKHFDDKEKLENIIQQIVSNCNRIVNEASPIVDARLESGERVNIVLPPIAINGPIITIRRFPKNPITIDRLVSIKTLTEEMALFVTSLVKAKYNIFISGGTGSGKTTFLNALSQYIPTSERIITIEDSAELQLLNAENLVKLETRNKNTEGCIPITIRDLIKTALRMRPERIIVGEVRGPEALDMLQAMNTGHDGSLSTGHSNSPRDMIMRLETMVLMGMDIPISAVRGQIASGIDILIHLERMRDGSRKVTEICEIEGICEGEVVLNSIYKWNGEDMIKVGELKNAFKLEKMKF